MHPDRGRSRLQKDSQGDKRSIFISTRNDLITIRQLEEPSPLVGRARQFTLWRGVGGKGTPNRSVRAMYFGRASRNRRAN